MPLYAKTSSQTVNNSTTLVTLTGLASGTLAANTVYRFEALFAFTSGSTPDIKFSLAKGSGLSDATAEWGEIDTFLTQVPLAFGDSKNFNSTTGNMIVGISGFVLVGTDPGTVVIQFAQNTANASDTTVLAAILEIYETEETTPIGKASDETRNSTTTFADDSGLVSGTLEANAAYKVEMYFPMVSGATPDLKFTFERSGLSDAALYWNELVSVGGGLTAAGRTFGSTMNAAGTGNSQFGGVAGILVTGSDPGALKMQWAQRVSDAGDTTVKAGAILRLAKAA